MSAVGEGTSAAQFQGDGSVVEKALPSSGEGEHEAPTEPSAFDEAGEAAPAPAGLGQAPNASSTTDDGSVKSWTVRNLTAEPLEFHDRAGILWRLPAHGRRSVRGDPRAEFDLRAAEGSGKVEVSEARAPSPIDLSPLALWVFLLPIAFGLADADVWWGWIGVAVAIVAPVAWVFALTARRREGFRFFLAGLPARVVQAVTFLLVLAFCVAVPAVTLYYGANLEPVVSDVFDGQGTQADYLTLVCRAMQLVLISVASLLPALLYYQFDRDRLSTLRERIEHQIFRLDSRMKTRLDIRATYGQQINEIYGPEGTGGSRKLPPGRRAPIFVATVLIMLGWLLVLLNPDVGIVNSEDEIADLFDPRQTAPAFAFLGAYFFTLFALLRGYVRRDLRPKSYSDISVRIVVVVILAWVLELMFVDDSNGLLLFAFLTGIVPQAALNRLREVSQTVTSEIRGRFSGSTEGSTDGKDTQSHSDGAVAAALADPLPLTDLQGIDLYDRTRLSSEGVTNIEALAHHDLIELMLLTRIPVPRLVDWTDQAILHLHVGSADRKRLRDYGIRTASDLVQAYSAAVDGKLGATKDEFVSILGGETDKPKKLDVIVSAIQDEPWMENILFWHGDDDPNQSRTEGKTVK